MAVPTITTISPAFGSATGCYVVEIVGTGFEVQVDPLTLPPPIPYPVPAPGPSVSVEFSDVSGFTEFSLEVTVLTSTRLYAVVPKCLMPLDANGETIDTFPVDITVRNLDTSGVPVPGEEVVEIDGFTYIHINISSAKPHRTTTIHQHLLALLRSEIIPNISSVPHTEYDTDVSTTFIEQAKLPHLVLMGPVITKSIGARQSWAPVETQVTGGAVEEYRRARSPDFYDYTFKLVGLADSTMVINNLQTLALAVIDRNETIRFPKDLTSPAAGYMYLDTQWTIHPSIEQLTGQFSSNIRFFRGEFVVRGVPIETIDPNAADNIQSVGGNLENSLPTFTIEDIE